jgi:hypothetical protein
MTEAEWNACTDPTPMLEFLRGTASDRKLRLFAVACCRRINGLLRWYYSGLEVAERYADSSASEEELLTIHTELFPHPANSDVAALEAAWHTTDAYLFDVQKASTSACDAIEWCRSDKGAEASPQTELLRCIFGPVPFRSMNVDPSWLTSTVKQLAQAIYAERAFDRMAILADALEDAGCTNADILSHCRQPGEHCRGCWVLDLLLGKE